MRRISNIRVLGGKGVEEGHRAYTAAWLPFANCPFAFSMRRWRGGVEGLAIGLAVGAWGR